MPTAKKSTTKKKPSGAKKKATSAKRGVKKTTATKVSTTRKRAVRKPAAKAPVASPRKTVVLQTMSDGAFIHNESPQVGMYRKIAVGFFVLTVVLFAAIFFTSVRRATITLSYIPELFTYADVIQLAPERVDEKTIAGTVEVREVVLSNRYAPQGREQVEVPVSGTVTIINNHTKDQPLVKTTRLLSPDGKLYRLSNGVVVPAGGEVTDVEIYADQDGDEFAIDPTEFTIPGLWEPLQKKIYAKNTEPFIGGLIERGVIAAQDMQDAESDMREQLVSYATGLIEQEEVEAQSHLDTFIVTLDSLSIERSAEIGDEVQELTLKGKANAVVVRYQKEELQELVRAQLNQEAIPEYLQLGYDPSLLTVRVESYDLETGRAQLSLFEQMPKVLVESSPQFSVEQFFGKSQFSIIQDVELLDGIDHIGVQVEFFPYWVHKVPKVGGTVGVTIEQIPFDEEDTMSSSTVEAPLL